MTRPTFPPRMPEASIYAGCSSIAARYGVSAGASEASCALDILTTGVSVKPSTSRIRSGCDILTKSGAGECSPTPTGGSIVDRGPQESCPLPIRPPSIFPLTKTVTVPLRTERGQNTREHWRRRTARVKAEKLAVAWSLFAAHGNACPYTPPLVVTLTRGAPSRGLDDDNLVGALKAIRDAVADWLNVDDRHRDLVRYRYAQQRSPEWFVRVEFNPATAITQE